MKFSNKTEFWNISIWELNLFIELKNFKNQETRKKIKKSLTFPKTMKNLLASSKSKKLLKP
jgi:hypothetical protein